MKPVRIAPLLLLFVLFVFISPAQIILTDSLKSDYRIIIPENAAGEEIKAAAELQKYILRISSVDIPVTGDDSLPQDREIVIGNSTRLDYDRIKVHQGNATSDGFEIRTVKDKLYITGYSPAGTLNGVYSFLETYLGCRFYSPGVMKVPENKKLVIPGIRDRDVPVFSYRELYFPGRYDTAYRAWHKLHSHHDGSWGMWVHTFDDLVPPGKYFSSHPEYFSEINGNRIPYGQLCLSNQAVLDTLTANLRKETDARPDAHYWSVSQNDNFLACQCSACRKIAEEYGGESGLMIWFVNRVAALFPDKVISTLAYQYTRQAPKHIRPLENVNIMLCSIECNRSEPISKDRSAASFVRDVKDWSKLTGNILIWDYVVQFRNYISPFPNLDVLQPNLDFFAGMGCRLMFQQGSGSSLSEFVDLRSYMIAKLLWDPEQDPEEIMDDFLQGYYREAAPSLKEYIRLMHDELEKSGDNLWIYGFPYSGIDSYLRPDLLPEYRKLLDQAEQAVAHNFEILERVRFARLPFDFAIMDISLHQVNDLLSWFSSKDGDFKIKEEMMNLLDTFVTRCDRLQVKVINERGFTPEEYRVLVHDWLNKTADRHLAIGKKPVILTTYSPKYDAGGAEALTDGIRGIDDYHFNWLGFEGQDMEAVIDLGAETDITEISADFLQDVQSWIFLPKSLTAYIVSETGELTEIGSVPNTVPENKPGSFIRTFSIPANQAKARYIKVRAESMKTCPKGHIGYGKSSWIFTDEIVVK